MMFGLGKDKKDKGDDSKTAASSQQNKKSDDVEEITLDIKKKDNNIPVDYFPLEGETVQDSTVKLDKQATQPIAEPSFKKPDPSHFQQSPPPAQPSQTQQPTQSQQAKPPTVVPPGMDIKDLPPEQKQIAAEQLVDLVLRGYDKIKSVGRWYVKVSDEDLMTKVGEGKIEPEMLVPLSDEGDKFCTVAEFIQEYNQQADKSIQVKPAFIQTVRPPMIRVCIKNNWGMSDEAYLAWMFGEDISTTIGAIYGFKKTMLKCLDAFEKVHAQNKKEDASNTGGEDYVEHQTEVKTTVNAKTQTAETAETIKP